VKSVPISPRHPDVPNTMLAGLLFSIANFFITDSNPLFLEISDSIAFQQEVAFSNS